MNIVVFLGPTLSVETARARLDATYLPPAARGDVLRALSWDPRAIAIIDGYFDAVPSVLHKEILLAMANGVHVFGASSMGALRAAELHAFGMVGVGQVFRWFRDGDLEDDDEVAVTHAPAESGFVPMSDAMVDVRDGIGAAVSAGILDGELAIRLVHTAKALHYRERSFREIVRRARHDGEDPAVWDDLASFLTGSAPRVKARDAQELLDTLRAWASADPAPLQVSWELQRTSFLALLERDVRQETLTGAQNRRAS